MKSTPFQPRPARSASNTLSVVLQESTQTHILVRETHITSYSVPCFRVYSIENTKIQKYKMKDRRMRKTPEENNGNCSATPVFDNAAYARREQSRRCCVWTELARQGWALFVWASSYAIKSGLSPVFSYELSCSSGFVIVVTSVQTDALSRCSPHSLCHSMATRQRQKGNEAKAESFLWSTFTLWGQVLLASFDSWVTTYPPSWRKWGRMGTGWGQDGDGLERWAGEGKMMGRAVGRQPRQGWERVHAAAMWKAVALTEWENREVEEKQKTERARKSDKKTKQKSQKKVRKNSEKRRRKTSRRNRKRSSSIEAVTTIPTF